MSDLFEFEEGFEGLDEKAAGTCWPWVRVPARAGIRFAVLSRVALTYPAHWWGHGFQPHVDRHRCEHCMERRAIQWRFVLCVHLLESRSNGLLEISADAGKVIRDSAERFSYLRGLVFDVSKDGGKTNGKFVVVAHDQQVAVQHLPEPVDLKAHLIEMWTTKYPQILIHV